MACRLAKCLAVGMNVNFFRKIIQENQKCRPSTKIVEYQSPTVSNQNIY